MEHAPRRTCVGCRTTRAKPDLVRIAATPAGISIDPDHDRPGRGAYVCPDPQCLDAIERAGGHTLRRALRTAQQNDAGITAVLSELHRRLEAHERPAPQPNDAGDMPAA